MNAPVSIINPIPFKYLYFRSVNQIIHTTSFANEGELARA